MILNILSQDSSFVIESSTIEIGALNFPPDEFISCVDVCHARLSVDIPVLQTTTLLTLRTSPSGQIVRSSTSLILREIGADMRIWAKFCRTGKKGLKCHQLTLTLRVAQPKRLVWETCPFGFLAIYIWQVSG